MIANDLTRAPFLSHIFPVARLLDVEQEQGFILLTKEILEYCAELAITPAHR